MRYRIWLTGSLGTKLSPHWSSIYNGLVVTANRVVLTSFFVDLLDIVINLTVTILTGSVVMVAETLQGTADLVAVGFLLIGIKRAKRRANKEHPYGFGREIYFWSLLSGLIIFTITSMGSLYLGFQRFVNPQPIHNLPLAYGALMISILSNGYAVSLSIKRLVGQRGLPRILQIFLRSSRVETKTTFILDLMGTSAAILGMISLITLGLTGNNRFDGLGGMLIGASLAILAFLLLLGIKDLIIGKNASETTEERIRQAALEIPQVKSVLDLKTLHIGTDRLLVNIEVHLENNLSTDDIEKLTDKIKGQIKEEVPLVKHVTVEIEAPN